MVSILKQKRLWKYLIFISLVFGCGEMDVIEVSGDFLLMSTEAKSCLLFNEGCGKSETLFAPKLDPNCGIEKAGEEVLIEGIFAFRYNFIGQTYLPWPIDKWKPSASTQYGFAAFTADEQDPRRIVRSEERLCTIQNTKIMGSRTVMKDQFFMNLGSAMHEYVAENQEGWLIGGLLPLRDGTNTWGLKEDFDVFNQELPTSPGDPWVIDEDNDGKTGVTTSIESDITFLVGDYYIVLKSYYDHELTICSNNQLQGYILNNHTWQNTLDTTAASGSQNLIAEMKPSSTVIFIKIDPAAVLPEQKTTCDYILGNIDTLFGGSGAAEIENELPDEIIDQ